MEQKATFWFVVGIVSFPGLFFPFGVFTFGYSRLTSSDPIGAILRIFWLCAIAVVVLSKVKHALSQSYSWEISSSSAWSSFRDVFLLSLMSALMSPSMALLDFFIPESRTFSSADVSYADRILQGADAQTVKNWIMQSFFIAFSLALIGKFFKFFSVWLSAAYELFSVARPARSTRPTLEHDRATYKNAESMLISQFLRNIESCNTRAYSSVLSMLALLAIALVSFIVVFQGSPTARALTIVSQLEQSPLLLAPRFFDRMDEIASATDEAISKIRSREAFQDSSNDEIIRDTQDMLETAKSDINSIGNFARNLASNIPTTEDSKAVLAGLADAKREIEVASSTNWDLIVVRTAIVLLSFFALKIFFRVYEAAITERRMWEERISAVNLIGSKDFKIGEYLALVGKIDEKDMSEFLDVEIDKIIQQIREMKK